MNVTYIFPKDAAEKIPDIPQKLEIATTITENTYPGLKLLKANVFRDEIQVHFSLEELKRLLDGEILQVNVRLGKPYEGNFLLVMRSEVNELFCTPATQTQQK